MNTHIHAAVRANPWKFRLRILMLIVLLTLGMGIAAIERWRQTDFDQVWGSVHEKLTRALSPISERTYRLYTVAFKIDHLLKVEDENKKLNHDMTELIIENQRLAEEGRRLNRLAGLGRWSGPPDLVFVSADVAGLITSGQSAALIINRGRDDGVRPRDPVVALGGLVGIVQSVSAGTARVQAITDPASAVGVMDRSSRARGVVFGGEDRKKEPLKFMPENEVQPINIGGTLITSGFENSVYPKGIIVGTITERKLNTYGIPYGIVHPSVGFESLEEVLLVIPRSRLTGAEAALTTETLGAKRIFMPARADRTDTMTTTSLTPMPPDVYDLGTSSSLAPPVPVLIDDNPTTTAMIGPDGQTPPGWPEPVETKDTLGVGPPPASHPPTAAPAPTTPPPIPAVPTTSSTKSISSHKRTPTGRPGTWVKAEDLGQ